MKTGLSIFTGLKEYSLEKSLNYLEVAHEHKIEMIFSSAHITEADRSIEELNAIIEKCNEYGMKFVIDVSKKAFENLNLSDKVYAYRLDYGFTDKEVVELSKSDKFMIELNASTLSEEKLLQLIKLGLNLEHVRASFNYYPKLYTAHEIEDAKAIIEMYNKYGISVGAFLPSEYGKRPPMYQGLPSIEKHRNQNKSISIEELKAIGVKEVFIGDAYASEEEIIQLENHCDDDVVLDAIVINSSDKKIFENKLNIRPDYNNLLLRFSGSRGINFMPNNCIERVKYSLTVDNALFGRYAGEINVVISDLPADERVNVIGHVLCSDIIVNKIKNTKKVKINII